MPTARRFPLVLPILVFLFAACGGGGDSGAAPPTSSVGLSIAIVDGGGVGVVAAAGIELLERGRSLRLAVLDSTTGETRDVTAGATISTDEATIAYFDGERLNPGDAGATILRGAFGGRAVSVMVTINPAASVTVAALDLDPVERLVLTSSEPAVIDVRLVLESGDAIEPGGRVDWRSLDPSIVTINSMGQCTAVSDGATYVEATLDGGAIVELLEVVVALPQASGATLGANGGAVAAGDAMVWIPPFALGGDSEVRLSELDEASLPVPLPAGSDFIGSVRLESLAVTSFEAPARVSLESTTDGGPANLGELAQVVVLAPSGAAWHHYAWIAAGPLGRYEWITDLPGLFTVMRAPGRAEQLAAQHAPLLVFGPDDIVPISVDTLLAQCDLYVDDGLFSDTLVDATPTPADLIANNTARHYLRLDDAARTEFENSETWRAASLGGIGMTGVRPMLYWSVRPLQVPTNPGGGTRSVLSVQYWMLSAASGKPQGLASLPLIGDYDLQHEGDLEFVQVLLDGGTEVPEPIGATASQHYYGEGRAYRDLELELVTGRWKAYVSQAGHATYFQRGFGGVGVAHGTTTGDEGFLGKISSLAFTDRCPAEGTERVFQPQADYGLVALDGPNPGATALRTWNGEIDGVPFVPRRGPGPAALQMYDHSLDFHRAYNFSTQTSIEAYRQVLVRTVERRIAAGQRMFELQERVRLDFASGAVQSRIDNACGNQPWHLLEFLHASPAYRAPQYFACDEWRLTRIEPPAPRMGVVGEPFSLRVDWSGVSAGSMGAVVEPLRVIVLPSFEGGYETLQFGTYAGPSGQVSFRVAPEWTIQDAAIGATNVECEVNWIYTENGVAMQPPAAACSSAEAEMDWRFNLFVRDASGLTLYHTSSIVAGPYSFVRDGPPIDIRTRLCH